MKTWLLIGVALLAPQVHAAEGQANGREAKAAESRTRKAQAAAQAQRAAQMEFGAQLQPNSTLETSSLQPASGLDSRARGLTPEDEWRRRFPKKAGGQER
jgi:hypothetical protein